MKRKPTMTDAEFAQVTTPFKHAELAAFFTRLTVTHGSTGAIRALRRAIATIEQNVAAEGEQLPYVLTPEGRAR